MKFPYYNGFKFGTVSVIYDASFLIIFWLKWSKIKVTGLQSKVHCLP